MADRLRETTVAEICQVFDGPHATPAKTRSGPIFLGITSLNKGRIDLSGIEHLSEEDFAKWTRRVTPRAGDVVFSYETKLGEAAIIPEGLRCCLGRRMALMRPDPHKADSRFLLYYYLGPEFQDVIRERTIHGSTVERLALIEFPNFPLRLPSLPEQKAISRILGTLDDKIELNRGMNETLEAIARALFKSWFVDFDPVRVLSGQMPDKPPFLSSAALRNTGFPDRFQDSELGEIPEGWSTGSILSHAKLLSGGTPKTDRPDYWNGKIRWASAKDVSQCGHTFLLTTERTISEQGLKESATQLIPAFCTVVVARGATTGRMVLFGAEMAMNQTCYALATTTGTPFALYCRLRHEMNTLVHTAHGSVFDTITTSTFASSQSVLPPKPALGAFEKVISPMFLQILANTEESLTLANLRDALLPKLLLGELPVRHPESFASSYSA